MIDLLKKGVFLGLGLFEEGREKVEALVDDLINAGEVAKEERAKTVEKYVQKIKEQEKIISPFRNNPAFGSSTSRSAKTKSWL